LPYLKLVQANVLPEAADFSLLTGSSGFRSADLFTSTKNAWIGIPASRGEFLKDILEKREKVFSFH